ncbi:MAG: hypothetical protein PHO10_09210 [Gemmiger sp.]|nr:hypothetical protein [Gemmiger sp.]
MILQVTETRTRAFDVRCLTEEDENAVRVLTGGGGLPGTLGLRALLRGGAVLGDYGGLPQLQVAAALLPLYGDAPLAMALRAAGYAADGQGAVLTAPTMRADYGELRHFLRIALDWAGRSYASYHIWAVAPARQEEVCAQYLASGFSLRGLRCLQGEEPMLIFADRPLPRWEEPVKRVHFADRRLPRLLEQGYGASDFGWDHQGMVLMLRPVSF